MDIEKRVETTFNLLNIPEDTFAVIKKAINMAATARRVGTVRLTIPEIRILRNLTNQMVVAAPVIPREMIEDEEEPEDEGFVEAKKPRGYDG